MSDYKFQCDFCHQRFVLEDRFMKHKCKQMIRDEEFRTPKGQAAWNFYQEWMKAHRRRVPPPATFMQSKFYLAFIRFADFARKVNLPDSKLFIWLMKEKDISPVLWNADEVYAMYIRFLDRKGDPLKQAQTTVDTLLNLAEDYGCESGDIFNFITANEVIHLLRQRRLSPWVLLNSRKFLDFYMNKASVDERIHIETIIRPDYWEEKFKNHPNHLENMKLFVKELNL